MQHKKLMGIVALLMCLTLVAPTVTIEAATTIYNNQTGTQDGYNYELWKDYGTTSMTLNGGGTFSCQWSNIGNALFRKGKKFDATKTYSQLGNITIDYGCNYQPNGNSYLCVYGWSKSPLVEFYIVDSWGTWRPPGGTSKGQIYVDGGTYDVYETTRVNQPSIEGNTTFKQYFAYGTHSFSLRGCSNNDKMAKVDLYIGGTKKGTFYYGGSYPAVYTINNVSHGTGNQEIKLVCSEDNGTWDAYVDYLTWQ